MHEEVYSVSSEAASRVNRAKREGRPVLAVGTTSIRVLESAWDDASCALASGDGSTKIFIYPGYRFKVLDALITNFHLPESTLVMLVIQKTKDIAVLMAVGAEARSIRRVFMIQGTLIGVLGTALGFGLGVPLALILKKDQFIKLPSDVYPVDYLPIRLDALDLTLIGVSALLLCFLSTLYPANRAASLRVSEALRYE